MKPSVDAEGGKFLAWSVEAALRIGVLALVFLWALRILAPFLEVVAWAVILAVALHPLHKGLTGRLGGRSKLSAILITLLALAVLLVPSWKFFGATVDEAREVGQQLEAGTLRVPPPPDRVRDWPLFGERTYSMWSGASRNLEGTIQRLQPEVQAVAKGALGAVAGLAGTVLKFFISILIAGVLLHTGEAGRAFSVKLATRLAGPAGADFVALAAATVRSVAQGVLGVALIQGAMAAIGFVLIGVPGAMVWALLVLILAILQLPPIFVVGPVIVWAFAHQSTTAAVIFLVYGGFVSISDTFLKPLLLGRGVNVPMLVILLGAIGGAIASGIIGLFVGAVVLAVAYQLMMAWLEEDADLGIFSTAGAKLPADADP